MLGSYDHIIHSNLLRIFNCIYCPGVSLHGAGRLHSMHALCYFSIFFLSAHDNSLTTYEVQYRGVDSPNLLNTTFFVAVTVPVGMTLSHTISGLMAYSAYNVSVRATNQYGVGDFSEEVTVRTEEGGECVYCNM